MGAKHKRATSGRARTQGKRQSTSAWAPAGCAGSARRLGGIAGAPLALTKKRRVRDRAPRAQPAGEGYSPTFLTDANRTAFTNAIKATVRRYGAFGEGIAKSPF